MSEASEALNGAYAEYQRDITDTSAFARLRAELLNLAEAQIRNLFPKYKDPAALAEDIVAEILLALPAYRGKAAFSTWAYRIAKFKAIDELRRAKGGKRDAGEEVPKKFEAPPPELLAELYADINHRADLTENEVAFVSRILHKGLPHPLSAADRKRLSRLSRKLGHEDVTGSATNSQKS
jgi:DNA-directed RNA polymerase specialized sigma24 family protein